MQHAGSAPSPVARVVTWGGALLFFLSLAYFLYTYAVTFAVPALDVAVGGALTWNVLLFTVFACHHSVFARDRVRAWIARSLPDGLERSFYVWVASLLFLAVTWLWQPVPGVAWQAEGVARWALLALQAVGVWLTLRSAAILDVRELAGIHQPVPRPAVFRASGPYGWVRHPIYTGWFLLVFAASPMTMTRLVFAVVSCAYLLIAIPFEERSMRAATPGAYERYMAQVRWKLIPGVY